MENKNEATTEPSYVDFEPRCKLQRKEGRDTLDFSSVYIDFKKQHLRVHLLEPGIVTITGERPVDETHWLLFEKQIKIPKSCKTNDIRAKLTAGGILYVIVPKETPQILGKLCSTEIVTGSSSTPTDCLFRRESSGSKTVMNSGLVLQAAGLIAVVVAFWSLCIQILSLPSC